MPKDTTTNKEKKTMWSRFTSWLATTWLGKALSTVKSWFSSSGATKAGAASSPASGVPNNDTEIPAPGLDKGQGRTAQVQNPDQNVGNGLSTTDPLAAGEPVKPNPTPVGGTGATPLSGSAGPDNGEESDMQETKQNPVQSDSTPLTQPQAPKVEKLSGKITVFQKTTLELNLGEHKNFDTLKKWQNPANSSANSEEFRAFMEHGGKTLYITGRYNTKKEVNGNMVTINSVGIHGTETVCGDDNLEGMKDLVGFSKTTTEVKVEISNVPFEAPEVKSSKTTENGSEIKKESEAKESANVVDTGSTQGNPQPQPQGDSKGGTGTAETEPKSPVLVVNGEDSSPKAAESSTEQPAATGAPAGGQFLDKQSEAKDKGQEEGQKVESNPEPTAVDEAGQQDKGGNPVVTPPVTAENLQLVVSGAATTRPEGEDKAAGPEVAPESPELEVESPEDQGKDEQVNSPSSSLAGSKKPEQKIVNSRN